MLDDQFKFVSGNFSRVGGSGSLKDHWVVDEALLNIQNVAVAKNGYLFVYVSNESNFDVYFDNLQVIHKPGAIVEETHYYPFGLTMAGISSSSMTGKSPNRLKYNRKEQQSKEFSDAKGLDWTDYGARMYDNQLGRWHHVDDFAEKYYDFSPYTSVLNNLIVFKDVDGRDIVNYNARGEKLGTFNLNGLNIGARN